jgi:hypothetical protein
MVVVIEICVKCPGVQLELMSLASNRYWKYLLSGIQGARTTHVISTVLLGLLYRYASDMAG